MRSFHNPGKVSGSIGVRGGFKHFWSSLVANHQNYSMISSDLNTKRRKNTPIFNFPDSFYQMDSTHAITFKTYYQVTLVISIRRYGYGRIQLIHQQN